MLYDLYQQCSWRWDNIIEKFKSNPEGQRPYGTESNWFKGEVMTEHHPDYGEKYHESSND